MFKGLSRKLTRVMPRLGRAKEDGQRGQTLVEFALILPLFLLMFFAMVDFGRGFYTWLLVTNAAREGALVAATQQAPAAVQARINDALGGLNQADLTITLTNVQDSRGQAVEVDLAYDFEYVTPIGGIVALVGGGELATPSITAHSSMRLE
jgi:Flp pilus assembly protein TadG